MSGQGWSGMGWSVGVGAAWCDRVVLVLGHFLWQGALIAVVAMAAVYFLRKASARARYGVLCAALLGMAACPMATLGLLMMEKPQPGPVADGMVWEIAGEAAGADAIEPPAGLSVEAGSLPGGPAEVPPEAAASRMAPMASVPGSPADSVAGPAIMGEADAEMEPGPRWQAWAAGAYGLGVVLMLGRLVLGVYGGRRLRRGSFPVDDGAVLQALARGAGEMGLAFTPALAYCSRVLFPVVVGVARPIILLPVTFGTGLTAEQVEMLLMHELAHLWRSDHVMNLVQRLVEAVLFFHPAVWYVSRRIRFERELCCDDLVVARGGAAHGYAASLLTIAEMSGWGRAPIAPAATVAARGSGESELRRRIVRLLEGPAHPQVRLRGGWFVPVVLAVVMVGAAAAYLHAEPPVASAGNSAAPVENSAVPEEKSVVSGDDSAVPVQDPEPAAEESVAEEVPAAGPEEEAQAGLEMGPRNVQTEGEALVREMAEACLYWLSAPPAAVVSYAYDHERKGAAARRFEVFDPAGVGSMRRCGITYDTALRLLARSPGRATFGRSEREGDRIRLPFSLGEGVKVACGNGLDGAWSGYFSVPISGGTLLLDAATKAPVELVSEGLTERFEEYVEVDAGHHVPLRIRIERGRSRGEFGPGASGGGFHYDWRFKVYEPGLWLFDRSYYPRDGRGESVLVAWISNVKVNAAQGVVVQASAAEPTTMTGDPKEAKEALGALPVEEPRKDERGNEGEPDEESGSSEKGKASLAVRAVGPDGRPADGVQINPWRLVPAEEAGGDPGAWPERIVWADPESGQVWENLRNIGAKDGTTIRDLPEGVYCVSAHTSRKEYGRNPTPFGISERVVIEGNKKRYRAKIRLQEGPPLTLKFVEAASGSPMPYVSHLLRREDGFPVGMGSRSFRLGGDEYGVSGFTRLPAGSYLLWAERKAGRPEGADYSLAASPMRIDHSGEGSQTIEVPLEASLLSEEEIAARWRYVAVGSVKDEAGRPLEGVEIRAGCGWCTLMPGGSTKSGPDGTYTLRFGPGVHSFDKTTQEWKDGWQIAIIAAEKPGFYETNFCQQGDLMMSDNPADLERGKPVVFAGQPYRLDFVMAPAAKVSGRLFDRQGVPVAHGKLSVVGHELPPSWKELKSIGVDENGCFSAEIPCKAFWFSERPDQGVSPEIQFLVPGTYDIELQRQPQKKQLELRLLAWPEGTSREAVLTPPGSRLDLPEAVAEKLECVSHVDDTAEGKLSLSASGHAVVFERASDARFVEAVQIFAGRYGSPSPPDEDFHLYLLNGARQVLMDIPYPYGMTEQGDMRWYTLRTPSVEVPERFCVALAFNPHQTKGIFLGKDTNVSSSHSLQGLPESGYQVVGDDFEWMVRVHLAEEPTGEKGVQRLADWSPPVYEDPFEAASRCGSRKGPLRWKDQL